MSRGPIPDYPADRPKVPEVADMIRRIYASPEGGAGCCLHVLTDDGNYDCAAFCLDYAKEQGHALCQDAAAALLAMTPSQRRRAVRAAHAAGRCAVVGKDR